jgi:hypothetical protein
MKVFLGPWSKGAMILFYELFYGNPKSKKPPANLSAQERFKPTENSS